MRPVRLVLEQVECHCLFPCEIKAWSAIDASADLFQIWAEGEGQPARPEYSGGPEMTQNPSDANQAPTSQIKMGAAADRPLLNVTSRPMSITSSPSRF